MTVGLLLTVIILHFFGEGIAGLVLGKLFCKSSGLVEFASLQCMLDRTKGRMPYRGSDAAGSQTLPKRKSNNPISKMAGIPEITRYTVISSTQAIRFYVVQLTGEKVTDMGKYADGIFDTLAHVTDEHDEVILGDNWFSLSRVPTLEEILIINRNLVKLGLVIDA